MKMNEARTEDEKLFIFFNSLGVDGLRRNVVNVDG